VVLENKKTSQTLTFPVNRWMDEDEEDGDIVREIAADWPEEEGDPPPGEYTVKYLISLWKSCPGCVWL